LKETIMLRTSNTLIAAAIAAAALLGTPIAHASGDADFNRLAGSFATGERPWVNPLAPQAAVDYVAAAESESADAKFIRHITYYTRERLDRGGWVNAYAPDTHYATLQLLLTVKVGDGVTSHARA
jgi:hypothetical protein